MAQPLNKVLYRRLQRTFGAVKIANEGEAMVSRPVKSQAGLPRIEFTQDGEYYRVNCPYCEDTRFRLYVSHMYGRPDAYGRKMKFLAICFNEGCLLRNDNADDLLDRLNETLPHLEDTDVAQGVVLPDEARVVQLPGPCTPLRDLPARHKARAYLEGRDFDPDYLSDKYDVSYCTASHHRMAEDRIIFPVYERKQLKGWQARYVGELPWKDKAVRERRNLPPKYFSCPQSKFRSLCIYNWDRMKDWETGVIVEGPTDVIRFGFMAGCLFGNTMTPHQKKIFFRVFRERSAVILLDPEEWDSKASVQLRETFEKEMFGRYAAVKLLPGTDPGSLDRDYVRDYVEQQAKKQGVKVKYRKAK